VGHPKLYFERAPMSEPKFPGFAEISESVYQFVKNHYPYDPKSNADHGDFVVRGQQGTFTHYHVFAPKVGYGEHVILRLNTIILRRIDDADAALNFVNNANQELSHSACLSHLILRKTEGNFIMSASQTVLLEYDHNLFHDIFSNHIMNNHWYIEMASHGGLPRGFEIAVNYEFGNSSGN